MKARGRKIAENKKEQRAQKIKKVQEKWETEKKKEKGTNKDATE